MNIFYKSGIGWFDTFANSMIWVLILAFVAFMIWLGYDLITGPRKQRAEVKRMLEGLDAMADTNATGSLSGAAKPFSPAAINTSDKGTRRAGRKTPTPKLKDGVKTL